MGRGDWLMVGGRINLDNGGLDGGGSSVSGKKGLDFGYIKKVELREFFKGLDVV